MNNYDLGQKYGEQILDNYGIPLRPGTPEYDEAFKQRYANLPSNAFTGQATPVQPTLNFAPGWDPASIRGLAWKVKGWKNQAELNRLQKAKEADINKYKQLQTQTQGDPNLLQQYEAEDAKIDAERDRLYNDGYNYKDGERVDYLPEGVRSFDYNFKFTPQIPDKPGQNLNNYMSNDAFKQYYELNRNAFDRADPNISMQEHYANWLRNKNYLPEAYKEQPGFFSQLGQGLMDNFTSNPLGFAGGLFNLYQGFKQAGYMKDYYNTQKDLYNTQKNIMLNNERRNQEQWDMLKRQRASSSL